MCVCVCVVLLASKSGCFYFFYPSYMVPNSRVFCANMLCYKRGHYNKYQVVVNEVVIDIYIYLFLFVNK